MSRLVSPAQLRTLIGQRTELAVLDVREEGVTARKRLFYSSIAPVGRLGLVIERLVPRRTTSIALVDTHGEHTERAAALLARWGYTDVSILEGGVDGWERAGFEVFSGTNVPGKAFGELIEHRLHTPNVDAVTLKARQDAGDDLVVLDSRPFGEFNTMNIPGGVDCAGAELVYRALAAAPSPDTLIVVNCAGRTRSILGAQSLINAGVPNPVAALTGGSMSWLLAGLELEHGEIRTAPRPDAVTLATARELAAAAARKAQVPVIDGATLALFERESGERTLYRFDVRDPLEYEAGHPAGWRSAPGGQFVQATDEYVGTLHARVVLRDDDGVRARMTASWLRQLGYLDVHVLDDAASAALSDDTFEAGPEPLNIRPHGARTRWIEPDALSRAICEGKAQTIDIDSSLAFRRNHVADARFIAASELHARLDGFPRDQQIVLASEDGVLAGIVAAELAAHRPDIAALIGGTRRWIALGLPLESGDANNLTGDDDAWYSPYHAEPDRVAEQMNAYLTWELELVEQVERDAIASINVLDFETATTERSRERLSEPSSTAA
ncbi:rhodanese domain-containing protein [Caballeronia arationis]|jgi:rhodanese-related sulfurtransferase|uniref:Rhodanese-related sulfurtransferase n=1 Tax=Caballeronia arationis TaxID=1777142 RepID=A0A7Z7I2P8_9BURK|nr:rhodanese-like domain-containing protein [Caballeronia arationis]SAK98824.1 rhodanese domain-containing protein [Caballeronia arationis]SOE56299.1 Rhodanese-related sulfurtransferase [Caballeronia arationis]